MLNMRNQHKSSVNIATSQSKDLHLPRRLNRRTQSLLRLNVYIET
jgi:hypothetical protein